MRVYVDALLAHDGGDFDPHRIQRATPAGAEAPSPRHQAQTRATTAGPTDKRPTSPKDRT